MSARTGERFGAVRPSASVDATVPSACMRDFGSRADSAPPSPRDGDFTHLWRDYIARNAPAAAVLRLAFGHYHRMVYSVAHRMLGSATDAEDVTQTVFEILHRTLDRVREPERVAGYLRQCAVREAIEVERRRRWWRTKGKGAVAMRQAPGRRDDEAFVVTAVHQLLAALTAEERAAVILRMVEHHSHDEVAELMDVSLSTVRRRLRSAHEKMNAAASSDAQQRLVDAVGEAT